ncbi:MAG TPA: TonB-dependent receptor, partial [Puia sp.]|nr:TonB-dependent receptor [Puia sp.]
TAVLAILIATVGRTQPTPLRATDLAAESAGRISGNIIDDRGQAMESVTVSLLQAADSGRVRETVTNKAGHFGFSDLPVGKYVIAASFVGYKTVYSQPVDLVVGQGRVVPPLVLVSTSTSLTAVAVVGRRPPIEQKPDRTIINVDASPANSGSTAMDVLEKAPGVTLDKDDNISLKGKQGVMVMIDGKPTYLSASQLAEYLRSLPASAIDQIELMTNPSAKYDASGNSGIINIKTKKNKLKGFNGNLNLTQTQGVYSKPSGSLNLNYRTGQLNFFVNGGYSHWEGFQVLQIQRKYLDNDPAQTVNSIFQQTTVMHFINPEGNLKFGLDYFVTPKTTIGFVVSGFANTETDKSGSNIQLLSPSYAIDSLVYSPNTNHTSWKNGSANLNFKHSYDSAGRELTADIDYVRYSSVSDQSFNSQTFSPDKDLLGASVLTGHLPSTINIYTAKTDYTRPLSGGYKLETGAKLSYVDTRNTADYYDVLNGKPNVDTTKTNAFLYRENVNALYVNVTKQYGKKWSAQAGLRAENTNYSGHQLGNGLTVINNDSSFSRSYINLFPTAYVSYQANEKNQFTLNYGRRIDRPAYQDLNPFLFFLDQYTYQAGNPYLQPQYTDNVELSYGYKHWLMTTLNYSQTKNFFTETFEQSGQATIVRHGNIGNRQNAGIAVSAQVPVTKWWMAILYSNVNYDKFTGMLYGQNLDVSATTLLLNVNNQFTFPHGWSGELSGFYRTKGVEGQVIIDPMGQGTVAIAKKILKDKASLKLAVRDFLYTNQVHGYINFQETDATFQNRRDSRMVALTFSWNFGKPMKGISNGGRRNGGAGEEESRVKAGGNGN